MLVDRREMNVLSKAVKHEHTKSMQGSDPTSACRHCNAPKCVPVVLMFDRAKSRVDAQLLGGTQVV